MSVQTAIANPLRAMNMSNTEQVHNQPGPLRRAQAFRMALLHEANTRGLSRFTATDFLREFGAGQSRTHLYHTLRIAGWSHAMTKRVDDFIVRHLPDWKPEGVEADTVLVWPRLPRSA